MIRILLGLGMVFMAGNMSTDTNMPLSVIVVYGLVGITIAMCGVKSCNENPTLL